MTRLFRGYSMREPHGRRMRMLAKPVICACMAAVMLPATGFAQPLGGPKVATRDHSQDGMKRRSQASGVSVREIERKVTPKYPGAQYLGFDYDPSTNIYTLKFLRNGSVIWVYVDGNSGDTVRITGN
ncbi:MAG: hypothetical protein EOP62_15115 [Sphingomonadales bacterium]|nr:MAG: hypothetical protein EOP62_15115 [Sphingomonadales bacterium]